MVLRSLAGFLGLFCSFVAPAHAQLGPTTNVFFGADYVLHPIAIKSACGGEIEADLVRLQAIITSFPEDAEDAGIQDFLDAILTVDNLVELVGVELDPEQTLALCAAALELDLDWLAPQSILSAEDTMTAEQVSAWRRFWEVVGTS